MPMTRTAATLQENEMKRILLAALLTATASTHAAPVVYTDKASYLIDLTSLGYTVIAESFEDSSVWGTSRNSIPSPGSAPSIASQGLVWTSNYTANNIATGTVGGSASDGTFAIYSLPHGLTTDSGLYCDSAEDPNIPFECFQNDGLKVASEKGDTLFAFGGHVDSDGVSSKITFLLDGVDVNANDFKSAELRELSGKDFQQVRIFNDDFTVGVTAVPIPAAVWLFGSSLLGLIGLSRRRRNSGG